MSKVTRMKKVVATNPKLMPLNPTGSCRKQEINMFNSQLVNLYPNN